MNATLLSTVAATALLGACAFDPSWDGVPDETHGLAQYEADGLLTFLNNQQATNCERLDHECGIRSDAALNLVEHRDGRDGLPGTDDDDLYDTIFEIEGVHMVGRETVDHLVECAVSFGYITLRHCQSQAFDASEEFEVVHLGDQSDLNAELTAKIEELGADAVRFADPASPNPVRFGDVAQYMVHGVPVFHQVTFVQDIDGKGVQIVIVYDLDNCLNTLDVNISI